MWSCNCQVSFVLRAAWGETKSETPALAWRTPVLPDVLFPFSPAVMFAPHLQRFQAFRLFLPFPLQIRSAKR